jgi:hypothetical protein
MGGTDRDRLARQFLPADVFDASLAAWDSLRDVDRDRGNRKLFGRHCSFGRIGNVWRIARAALIVLGVRGNCQVPTWCCDRE